MSSGQIAEYLIIGGGTAGCVLAERLSRSAKTQVILLEAGQDTPPGATPANILDIYPSAQSDRNYYWPLSRVDTGLPQEQGSTFRPIWRFAQARVMGGGGSVMGMIALRGVPADYDDWREKGCVGWGWSDVLPYFVRLERDNDFGGAIHGSSGPIPIRRVLRPHWPPFLSAAATALNGLGHNEIQDMNGGEVCGFGPTPKSSTQLHRVSSAQGYLDGDVRRRPNLHILAGVQAERILFEGARAVGVSVNGGPERTVRARQMIISCGAIHSPALLMRSGVGPAAPLRALGIEVRADLPGVGANLQNHPMLTLAAHLRSQMRQSRAVREMCSLWIRYSSGIQDCPPADMSGNILAALAPHAVGAAVGAVGISLYKPFSLGLVRIADAHVGSEPLIRFNLLSDTRDQARMTAGLIECLKLLARPEMQAAVDDIFIPDPAWAMRLGGSDWRAQFKSGVAAAALDLGWLRRRLLGANRLVVDRLLSDRAALEELTLQITGLGGHVAGTCRMGDPSDENIVVDPLCRVRGVSALRVVDASIMPTIVSANTNLTVQMIAERAADLVLEDSEL